MIDHPVELLWISRSDFPEGQVIRPHAHEGFFHLFYGMDGGADFVVEGQTHALRKGALLLAGMGRTHEMKRIQRGRALFAELKFQVGHPELREALMRRDAFARDAEAYGPLILSILREAEQQPAWHRECMRGALQMLVSLLAREAGGGAPAAPARFSRATLLAMRHIDRHCAGPVSLEDIARASGMNPNYVCTLFKRETGVSTNEYLNMARVARAARLLQYGEMEVAQIAGMCGFTNPSHFCRTFKRYAGILPSQCRQLFYPSVVDMDRYGGDTFQTTVPSERLAQMLKTLEELSRAQGSDEP